MTKEKKTICFAACFYFIGILALLFFGAALLHPRLHLRPMEQLLLIGLFCLGFYFGSRILCRIPKHKEGPVMRLTFFLFFMLYLLLLFSFTLFEPVFGRSRGTHTAFSHPEQFAEYTKIACNLVPFSTITAYIKGWLTQSISFSVMATNLFGNLLALMPMALFLPMFQKRCKRFVPFLLTVAGVVLLIECLQLFFMVGSFDTDDLILNTLGACILFFILTRKSVSRWLTKVTFAY